MTRTAPPKEIRQVDPEFDVEPTPVPSPSPGRDSPEHAILLATMAASIAAGVSRDLSRDLVGPQTIAHHSIEIARAILQELGL